MALPTQTQVKMAVMIPATIMSEAITMQMMPAVYGPSPHSLCKQKHTIEVTYTQTLLLTTQTIAKFWCRALLLR